MTEMIRFDITNAKQICLRVEKLLEGKEDLFVVVGGDHTDGWLETYRNCKYLTNEPLGGEFRMGFSLSVINANTYLGIAVPSFTHVGEVWIQIDSQGICIKVQANPDADLSKSPAWKDVPSKRYAVAISW